jgi:hypothetical protein
VLRRLCLSLLLSFGLLLAQQAALLHELGHDLGREVPEAVAADGTHHAGDSARTLCEKCLAFAQLADALPSQWHLPDAAPQRLRETVPCATGTAGQTAPTACSRGPPRFL